MMNTKHEEYTGPSREQIATWIETLEEKDLNRRREARLALTECGSGCLMMMLDELLEGPFQVRWEIAKALVDMKDPKATGALIKALEDDEQDVRWLAAVALANLGRPALATLLKSLIENDESVYLRQGVHHVLSISEYTRRHQNLAHVRDALGPMEDVTGVRPAVKAALQDLEN
jgi:hypothetical protein